MADPFDDGDGHIWFKVECDLSRLAIEDAMSIAFAVFSRNQVVHKRVR